MKDKKDDIGNLFGQAFEDHSVVPEKEEWDMLNASLQKRNFYYFNATQFNIYYASSIVFCFLVCLGVGSHYTYHNFMKPNLGIENQEISTKEKVVESQKTFSTEERKGIPTNQKNVETIQLTEQKTIQKNEKEIKSNEIYITNSIPVKAAKKDSIPPVSESIQPKAIFTDSLPAKPKQKRVVYITKQDTIVKYDTLKVPKQKKKWLK